VYVFLETISVSVNNKCGWIRNQKIVGCMEGDRNYSKVKNTHNILSEYLLELVEN